eukprot:gnl/MRDRNA2_/MRDRNA2_110744_c0_seq1.p1 gnl/MRDRNA2_/MRDRNA2_110744_c0~~gnl/MRDRNA2_/MRDRNA2_110744_c0_seq1.p1  ORF type:complete len:561 (+),score=130.14 gnl/MRDRNA2_/MRDRNA2_110744_c0_seq1:79-1761(+)
MGGKPSKKADPKAGVVAAQEAAVNKELNSTTRSESGFPVDGSAAAPRAAEMEHSQQASATDQGWRPGGVPDKPVTPPAEPKPKDSSPRSPPRSRPRTPPKTEGPPATESPAKPSGTGPLAQASENAMTKSADIPTEPQKGYPKATSAAASPAKAEVPVKAATPAASFDVDAEEFNRIITQAFGPMIPASLTSTKWDKRVNALKGVGTVLKGLSLGAKDGLTSGGAKGLKLRDDAECFRAACLVLQRAMRDKVLPVLLASHELFREAFDQAKGSRSDQELKEAMDTLLPHALVKLGDSNIRLHDSAKEIVSYAAEQSFFGLSYVLELLRNLMTNAGRGHSRAKILGGIVDGVSMLVERFPGKRMESQDDDDDDAQMWCLEAVFPFIEAGLDDIVGPRTRTAATKLAVTVHSTLGKEALQPLLDKVRPAIKNLLLQKFQEEEGQDEDDWEQPSGPLLDASVRLKHEDTMGLVLCGTACKITSQSETASSSVLHTGRSLVSDDGESHSPSKFSDREESLMDNILEETGLVFGKGDKVNMDMEDEILGLGLGQELNGRSPIECY